MLVSGVLLVCTPEDFLLTTNVLQLAPVVDLLLFFLV